MLKVLLCQPPMEDFYTTAERHYPLGLTCLAGAVRDLTVDIKIKDFLSSGSRQTIQTPKNFSAVLPHFLSDSSPIKIFQQYYHFGESWKGIDNYFQSEQFDIVGISSLFYTYSEEVLKLAEIIKSKNPETKILIGGQNINRHHTTFFDSPHIDFLLEGEAEKSFRQFIRLILSQQQSYSTVPGLFYKEKSGWKQAKAKEILREFPVLTLDYSSLDLSRYKIQGKKAIMLSTTRGCPVGCDFCSIESSFGKKIRKQSIPALIDFMKTAYSNGIRVFDIEDDNFTLDKNYATDLLQQIKKHFSGKIDLYAMNGLSAEHLDKALLTLMADAGFKMVNLSLAIASDEALQNMNRAMHLEKFENISRIAYKKDLKVVGYFIAGLPDENIESAISTMKVLAELPLILGISPFYHIPGIKMNVPNRPVNFKDARLTRFFPAASQWTELDLITLFRLSRLLNYIKAKLTQAKLTSLPFEELKVKFSDDKIIYSFIEYRKIIGIQPDGSSYDHSVSKTVINSFWETFMNSNIHQS